MDELSRFPIESQKMEMVGRLASSIIHDLNNLLTVIQLNASLIEGGLLEAEETVTVAGKIGSACERASDLTRNVLNLARRGTEEMRDVEIRGLVAAMARLLESLVAKKVAFDLQFTNEELWVRGVAGAFEQVLMNLILNAVDAMPRGGHITISCGVRAVADRELLNDFEAGEYVAITVTDTGCGIAPELRDRIFEPFFTTRQASGGTGMGLYTVDRVVRSHRGRIDLVSEVDRGTAFTVLFPRIRPAAPVPPATAGLEPQTNGSKHTVLLVEDDAGVRTLTRDILERNGFLVMDAETGRDAIALWNADPARIDVVVADLVLAGDLTGTDVAHQLRSDKPGIAVIYMSGFVTADDDQFPLDGATFLSKPFAPSALVRAVRDSLKPSPQRGG